MKRRMLRAPFDDLESARLRRLVNQAWDLRGTPYVVDAAAAIVAYHEETLPDRLEREALRRRRG